MTRQDSVTPRVCAAPYGHFTAVELCRGGYSIFQFNSPVVVIAPPQLSEKDIAYFIDSEPQRRRIQNHPTYML